MNAVVLKKPLKWFVQFCISISKGYPQLRTIRFTKVRNSKLTVQNWWLTIKKNLWDRMAQLPPLTFNRSWQLAILICFLVSIQQMTSFKTKSRLRRELECTWKIFFALLTYSGLESNLKYQKSVILSASDWTSSSFDKIYYMAPFTYLNFSYCLGRCTTSKMAPFGIFGHFWLFQDSLKPWIIIKNIKTTNLQTLLFIQKWCTKWQLHRLHINQSYDLALSKLYIQNHSLLYKYTLISYRNLSIAANTFAVK